MEYNLKWNEDILIRQNGVPIGQMSQITGGSETDELGLYSSTRYLLGFQEFYKEWEIKAMLNRYLAFEPLEDTTFQFTGDGISYSIDLGNTWVELPKDTDTPVVSTGNLIFWKGEMTPQEGGSIDPAIGKFISNGYFNAKGNVMSLLFGDNAYGKTDLTGYNSAFKNLFRLNQKLVNACDMILPATTLSDLCYWGMFSTCTNLISAPYLPALQLKPRCYEEMFFTCFSLYQIRAMFITEPGENFTRNWLFDTVFYKPDYEPALFTCNVNAEWVDNIERGASTVTDKYYIKGRPNPEQST